MNFALIYLGQRLIYRIFEFLRHWYIKSIKMYFNFILNKLESLDRHFAFVITVKHIFQPLYKDYSIIGYVLGFLFRLLRLIIGAIVYTAIFIIAVFLYLVWLIAPIYILYQIIAPFLINF